MRRFLILLGCLASVSFLVGWQSVNKGEANSSSKVTENGHTQSNALGMNPTQMRRSELQNPEMPVLPPEILNKVQFEKISGGEVTAVARRLLQLSADQCSSIKELITWREAELLALRYRQEQKAYTIESDRELLERYASLSPMLTWEIPIGDRGTVTEEFHDRVTKVAGTENANRLFGKRQLAAPAPGVRRHQISASKRNSGRIVRIEYTDIDGKRYNTNQSLVPISELSDEFRAKVERELALLEE